MALQFIHAEQQGDTKESPPRCNLENVNWLFQIWDFDAAIFLPTQFDQIVFLINILLIMTPYPPCPVAQWP